MQIRCLLWDFGDTFCDERFIWSSGAEWMDKTAESIVEHTAERCNHINFFQKTYEFFKAPHLPQAIVTVNPEAHRQQDVQHR